MVDILLTRGKRSHDDIILVLGDVYENMQIV